MNDNEKNEPDSKSPFWRFSIKFYGMPGVAPACIELQDQAMVDVNVLFFLLCLILARHKFIVGCPGQSLQLVGHVLWNAIHFCKFARLPGAGIQFFRR